MSELEVIPFRRGPFWNFSYLLACTATARAAVIDPAWDGPAILAAARERGLTIEAVVLTHSHTDHVNALTDVLEATGAPVFCHEAEAEAVPGATNVPPEGVHGGETLRVGQLEFSLLHTPGHSPGSLSMLANGYLFSGDTLLVGGVGRPGPGGVEALWDSVCRLRVLLGTTVIHPGHDEGPTASSTLATELERVAALRAETFAEFVRELERSTGRRQHALE